MHETAFTKEPLIYNDYKLPFNRILEDNKHKCIHKKNIESLAIEIYKFQAGLTPPFMSDLFVTRENNYNLRNFQEQGKSKEKNKSKQLNLIKVLKMSHIKFLMSFLMKE